MILQKLKVKLGRLLLQTPVVCASGTVGFGQELAGLADFKYIGAIITKTITCQARAGNPPPRIFETECGVLNSVGLENPGLEEFISQKLPCLPKLGTKSIVSVGGFSQEEYETLVKRLDKEAAVQALEINLSCPNLQLKKMVSQNAQATFSLVKKLRKITKKNFLVKVTPEVTDITEIAQAVYEAGADGLSLVNTFFGMAININTGKPYLGNVYGGYSGKAIKPMSLYRVWKVHQALPQLPLLAGGGIETANDAIEFLLAGATAVSIGTMNMVNPNQAKTVVKGIKEHFKI